MAKLARNGADWNDTAPVQVIVEREIAASADAVWAELADHERWPEWFPTLAKVEVTGAASGVGAERRVHVKGAGAFEEIFYAWDENEAFGFTILETRLPLFAALNELITLTATDDGVLVRYQQAIEPKGWATPLVKLATKRLHGSLAEALDGLAARVGAGD